MKLKPVKASPLLAEAAALASEAGLELYAVGGCARDWALGLPGEDVDFLVSGDAAPLAERLAAAHGGKWQKFGPFQTLRYFPAAGGRLDFARFRRETYDRPAALPRTEPAGSVEEDLKRRDFACNAMAVRLDGADPYGLVDPFDGLSDVKSGVLRVLHAKSFEDDPTRLYRAARFAGRLGWKLDPATRAAAEAAVKAGAPGLLSRERLRNELVKILSEQDPLPALGLLKELGALAFIHPKFDYGPDLPQGTEERLAAIARRMGQAGADFLAGLNLSKKDRARLSDMAGLGGARG